MTQHSKWLQRAFRTLPLLALPIVVSAASADDDGGKGDKGNDDKEAYAIGLWGDLPYSDVQAAALPNMIADMNAQKLQFTVNDGDLKAGSNSPCNDALYTNALATFNTLKAPAAFTPGDNDWTDCDRRTTEAFRRENGSTTSARCSSPRRCPWAKSA